MNTKRTKRSGIPKIMAKSVNFIFSDRSTVGLRTRSIYALQLYESSRLRYLYFQNVVIVSNGISERSGALLIGWIISHEFVITSESVKTSLMTSK